MSILKWFEKAPSQQEQPPQKMPDAEHIEYEPQTGRFSDASDLEDLYDKLHKAGEVTDSHGHTRSADDIIAEIENCKEVLQKTIERFNETNVENLPLLGMMLKNITRNEGLRDAVRRVLIDWAKQEQSSGQ